MQDTSLSPLLEVSTQLVTARSQRVLFELLWKLQPLLGFERISVVVDQGEQQRCYFIAPPRTPAKEFPHEVPPDVQSKVKLPCAWSGQEAEGRAMNLAELQAMVPDYPDSEQMQAAGLTYLFGAVLRHGAQTIGFLGLHYRAGQLPQKKLPSLRVVADMFTIALNNLLAGEQVERLQRKLLAPDSGSTPARPRDYMARTIIEAFRQFLAFDASCFIAYDQKLTHKWFYLDDLPPAITEDVAMQAYFPKQWPGPEPISCVDGAKWLAQPDLRVFDRAGWLAEPTFKILDRAALERMAERGFPILQAVLRAGVQDSLSIHLRVGAQPVAMLALYSFRAGHFATFGPIFPQVEHLVEPAAIGISNVMAQEALQAADQEKALQLAVGRAMMTSTTENQLFAALAQELNLLIRWDVFMAVRLSDVYRVHYQRKNSIGFLLPPVGLETLRDEASMDETSFARALQAQQPLYQEVGLYGGRAFKELCVGYPLLRLLHRLDGIQSALYLPLPLAGGDVVTLVLLSRQPFALTEISLSLLQRLSPQITLALQNQAAFAEIIALKQQVEEEKNYLVEESKTAYNFEEIVGTSAALQQVFRGVAQVAPTGTTVLIGGETGTGKELIARAIHARSPRRDRVLIKINCASLPAQLIESELFGHEKGAFTGAYERRIGKFELAQRGTIFLDEVGELPLELQAKLLRVLQEREIERLGGSKVITVDVRIIAATNRVLADEVQAGRFRADLYYRLSVFPLVLPALRERPIDIPLLAEYFGQKFARRMNRPYRGLRADCLPQLLAYSWPGNVRELENIMERAVIVSNGQPLDCSLPLASPSVLSIGLPGQPVMLSSSEKRAGRDHQERLRITEILQKTHWRIRGAYGAAALLDLNPTTLEARIKRLGIRK